MHQFGGAIVDFGGDGKWKTNFANEAGRNALKQYLQLIFTDNTVTPEMPADADAFERGQTAMFIRRSWVIGDIAKKAPNLKCMRLPRCNQLRRTADQPLCRWWGDGAKLGGSLQGCQLAGKPCRRLRDVGWLPNRAGVDYSSVTSKQPAFAAFVDYPQGYNSSRCRRSHRSEILTRVAAQLTVAFADPRLRPMTPKSMPS